jgi:membrane protein involved in colicin uptake
MNGIIEDEIIVGTPIGEIIPPEEKASELFVPNGLDKIIALIRKEVEQFQPDISCEKGRKAIASLARKVSSSMARLEDYGKNLSMDIKRKATDIDAERKRMKEALTALRDQARKPLTDYEEAVKARVDAHEQALKDVIELSNVPFGATVAEIEARIAKLDEFVLRNWEEFAKRAELGYEAVSGRLTLILTQTKAQEEQQAAFAKLEAERIVRESMEAKERQAKEQAERDERVAREATEKAERDTAEREAKAKRDTEAAEARAVKAEQDAKDAAERAVAAEQKRTADAKAAEDAATKAREDSTAHKTEIYRVAIAAVVALGISDANAKKLVVAIAQGKIPHTKIIY